MKQDEDEDEIAIETEMIEAIEIETIEAVVAAAPVAVAESGRSIRSWRTRP